MPVRCLIIKYATLKGLFVLSAQFGAVHKTGGISVSGIALILLAAHKCALDWPASHATVTYYP